MASVSPITRFVAPAAFAVGVLACAHAAPKPQEEPPPPDEDAPAASTWAAMHAAGTHVQPAAVAPAAFADVLEVVEVGAGLRAAIARPPAAPSTSDTPVERLAGVVLVPQPGEAMSAAAKAFASAGFVAIVPASPSAGGFFAEVDDVRAAARFLASEPDVDVDHLYAFGDGRVACQLALDPDTPFRAVGALGATTAKTFAALPAFAHAAPEERVARALLPHAAEVSTRLVIYAADTDEAAIAVRAKNEKIELSPAADPLAAFVAVMKMDVDAATSRRLSLLLWRPSSRSVP